MSDKIQPLCDQPKWNHIRHRCCCVFDHDSDKNEPLAECYYHERIRARLAEAERDRDGGWKAFYALRKAVGEDRYPGLTGVVRTDPPIRPADSATDAGWGSVTDGISRWQKCGPDCTLEVVRPGKVQCDCGGDATKRTAVTAEEVQK